MSFKLQSLSEYDRFVAIDIGAYRVKVLICAVEGGSLRVYGRASTRQSKKNVIAGEIADLAAVSDTVRRTILKAAEGLESLPEEVVLSINSSALLYDSIGTNYIRNDAEDSITMEEIDRMIASTEGKSLDRVRSKAEERFDLGPNELRLVTTSLTSIALDGKKVSNPVGFTAKNVKLTLVNFFVPQSTFQALSLIVRDLSMKLVSVIPVPVALPKLIEERSEAFDANAFVDVGYSRVTVTLSDRSELLGAVVLDFGYSLLEESLRKEDSALSGFDIEDRLSHPEKYALEYQSYAKFHDLVSDGVRIALSEIAKSVRIRNFFFSGGGNTELLRNTFSEKYDPTGSCNVASLPGLSEDSDPSYALCEAVAVCAKEFASLRKDPIARILRYVIYRYE
ncbi:MAG: cell division protein FtsA [Patescibacteria group bacterium]|nr:cell division protein FtsA [Patescibacteria group bacterium]